MKGGIVRPGRSLMDRNDRMETLEEHVIKTFYGKVRNILILLS